MKGTGNGRERGRNGQETGQESAEAFQEPRLVEDESGATLNSGVAVCRFNAVRGGRLERWQWRGGSPPTAQPPHSRPGPPGVMELVDPEAGALIDHFLPLGTRPEEFAAGLHREFGDFVEGEYRYQAVDSGGEIRIGLLRDGEIRAGQRVAEVRLAKSAAVRPEAGDLAVLYRVINSSMRPMQILFAVEFNVYAPGLGREDEGYYLIDGERPEDPALASPGVSPNATTVAVVNPGGEMALQIGWDREADLWRMPAPVEGPGARLLAVWRIQLPPRDNWAMGLWMAPG